MIKLTGPQIFRVYMSTQKVDPIAHELIAHICNQLPTLLADLLDQPFNIGTYVKAKIILIRWILIEEKLPTELMGPFNQLFDGLMKGLLRRLLVQLEAVDANPGKSLVTEKQFMAKVLLCPKARQLLAQNKLTISAVLRLNPELIINNK